jgi:hypothetical protein
VAVDQCSDGSSLSTSSYVMCPATCLLVRVVYICVTRILDELLCFPD